MALGGEVDHGVRPEPREGRAHRLGVADVGAQEFVAGQGGDRRQRGEVRGVGQVVDVEHAQAQLAREVPAEGGADEAGAAGDEDPRDVIHGWISQLARTRTPSVLRWQHGCALAPSCRSG